MVDIVAFKANSEDTNLSVFGDATPSDAISIVPSTLMKAPSSEFAIGYSAVFNSRTISCEFSYTASDLTVSKFMGNLLSNVGLHIVSFKEELVVNVNSFGDNDDSIIYVTFTYNENSPSTMEYPLDDAKIVSQSSSLQPPSNSVAVCKVTVSSGAITDVSSMVDPLLVPALIGDLQDVLSSDEIADLYLTINDAENTYVTPTYLANNYLSQTDADNTYLSQTDADNTYLSQTDASNTYLSQTNASNTYLSQTDAENTYTKISDINNTLTSTSTNIPLSANMGKALKDEINTKLTYNAKYVRDLTEVSSGASYNRLSWVNADGSTSTLDKLHQQLIDFRVGSFPSSVRANTSVELRTSRGISRTATNVDTILTDIKGCFIGDRRSSWFDLAMYLNLSGFLMTGVMSSDNTDRWSITVKVPLEDLLIGLTGNSSLLLNDPTNANATYQGACNIQLTGFLRDSTAKVFIPHFVGFCWITDGVLNINCQGDVLHDYTGITDLTGIGVKVKISGIGRI